MKEHKITDIQRFLHHFKAIMAEDGKVINPIPDNVRITVYCNSGTRRGFVTNNFKHKLGLDALIAESWILEHELDKLIEDRK